MVLLKINSSLLCLVLSLIMFTLLVSMDCAEVEVEEPLDGKLESILKNFRYKQRYPMKPVMNPLASDNGGQQNFNSLLELLFGQKSETTPSKKSILEWRF
ncbi:hypothetical protein SNEBB_007230 [Seison nebaliae]|nr:hypothetical protein SNEBB_007230 [Seison nebaliae]